MVELDNQNNKNYILSKKYFNDPIYYPSNIKILIRINSIFLLSSSYVTNLEKCNVRYLTTKIILFHLGQKSVGFWVTVC